MAQQQPPTPRGTQREERAGGESTASGRSGPEPATDPDLGDLVMRVARSLRRRGAEAMAPWDLAPHQVRALRVVGSHQGIRPGELAAHLRVAPRSVTDVVDALEQRGLLERHQDPGDRRATVLALTASGQRLVDETGAARRSDAEAYFARLPERDRATLRRILTRLDDDS
jgi:DNA-binding MarR family transcriptional regulator